MKSLHRLTCRAPVRMFAQFSVHTIVFISYNSKYDNTIIITITIITI
jgi:hypothetical protein